MFELILGTRNANKVIELRGLLPEDRVRVTALADFPEGIEVVEDGETFAENAAKKAGEQAAHLGHWVLGEDSGISVNALGGQPGIHSARFAGRHGDDEANNDKLLAELAGVPAPRRGAAYHCALALADPQGKIRLEVFASCRGRITTQRCGTGGFGYDPLFLIPEYHRTFGELGPTVKRALSHRSRAIRQFVPRFLQLLESLPDSA